MHSKFRVSARVYTYHTYSHTHIAQRNLLRAQPNSAVCLGPLWSCGSSSSLEDDAPELCAKLDHLPLAPMALLAAAAAAALSGLSAGTDEAQAEAASPLAHLLAPRAAAAGRAAACAWAGRGWSGPGLAAPSGASAEPEDRAGAAPPASTESGMLAKIAS